VVLRLPRKEFFEDYFDYRAGQHVAAFGPTQRAGKTHLLFQALQSLQPTRLDITGFCMKPRDRTVAKWSGAIGLQEIPVWPPRKRLFAEKPPGHILWPRHTFDPDVDNEHIRAEFRKAMLAGYKRGDCILFLDEVYGICAELNLVDELLAILTRGGGMGCGAWVASQKPSGTQQASLPGFIFNCPTHMFLAPDNDKRNRLRYGELSGGFDPRAVEDITLSLNSYEFLYLHAAGYMCVVQAA
jgi:hypothetical protein